MGAGCSSSRTAHSPPPPYGRDQTHRTGTSASSRSLPHRNGVKNSAEWKSPTDVIREKAEEFWKEIKDIEVPNVTRGKTTEEIIQDIIKHEKEVNGIDWQKAVDGGKDERDKAMRQAHEQLRGIRNTFTDDDVTMAKSMGLLDENGNVHNYDLFAEEAETTTPLAPIPGSAAPYMVWGWNKQKAASFQTATGDRIKALIVNLIRNFQVMKGDSTRFLVKTFMEAGLWGVGLYGLKAVWRIVRTLAEMTEATEAYAVLSGMMEIGVNVIKLGITIVVLAILVPLFIYMTKDAAGIMVIINDTDTDMRLIDLHATHGKIVGIFKEHATVDNPQPIIPKKLPPIVNPKNGKILTEGSIQAGFFAARKRDAALIGSQGGLRFDATPNYPKGIYVGWEVPLSQGKNCVLVSADYTGSASEFSNKTNDDGTQNSTATSNRNARVTGRVNSGSGSEAYYVINITDPPAATAMLDAPRVMSTAERARAMKEQLRNMTIPDVTKGKTTDQVMSDILDHERTHHGVDWRAATKEGPRAMRHAMKKAHERLHKIRKVMSPREVESAKALGLLNANGDVKDLDLLGEAAAADPNLAPIPSGAGTFTCWGWTKEQAAEFQNATGDKIKELILNLIRNFQVMEKSDTNFISHLFMEMGLWGLGAAGLHAVWKTLKTIEKVADGIVAIADGIIEVGLRVIQFAVSVFILAILVPIFVYAMKDASGVMVILNDTKEDMNLEQIEATHGKIIGVFKEDDSKNPRPIIPRKNGAAINDKGNVMASGSIFAGFFAVRKNDNALVGSQGALKFSSTESYPKGVFIGWEVPLSQGNNRLLVGADYSDSVKAFSDKTNDEDKQEDSSTSTKNAKVLGRVNDGNGSQAYYIINISEPAGNLLAMAPGESVEEKAEKFWNEIKDLKSPNVTQGKSSDEVIADIIKHEKTHNGIDWEAAAKEGTAAMKEAMKKAHSKLQDIRTKMTNAEVDRAKKMGLLDSKGEVPMYDILGDGILGTAPIPDGAAPYTIWGWNVDNTATFQNATGDRIKDLILNLVRNFQVMNADDVRMMTKTFMDCGLWAVGGYGIIAVVKILRTLYKLTQATEAFAVVSGIMDIGVNIIKIGIATVILAILVPFFIYMKKNAGGLMIIINDTEDDLELAEYHTTHGKIIGIFKENAALDNPKPIIPKRLPPIINPKTGKQIAKGSIQAGFFATQKNDNALVGSQGALKFSPMTSFPKGIFLGWEVPLSEGSNRLLVSADFTGTTSQFSDNTNNADKQEDTANGINGGKIVGRVHSPSGSQGYYIINVTEPKTAAAAQPAALLEGSAPSNDKKEKSNDDLLNQIFEHEKKHNGIDWKAAAEAGRPALNEAIKKAHDHLRGLADKMTKEERQHAISMGLLDNNGQVPTYDLLAEHEDTAATEMFTTGSAQPTVPIPSSAAPYMVWGWKPSVALQYQSATGNDIKTKVLNLIRDFQAMKHDTKEQMVNAFMSAGIWGVGLTGLKAAWRAFRAASVITEAVEAEAIADGIAVVGMSIVTLAIATVILAILVPIFIFMSKDASVMIMNHQCEFRPILTHSPFKTSGIAIIGVSVVTLAIRTVIHTVFGPIFMLMSKDATATVVIMNEKGENRSFLTHSPFKSLGIAVIGVSVVTLAIATVILAVLVPIFIFMSKDAAAIMVIMNDTDEDMRMVDLHCTHGKVIGIFKEKAELDNPQPILEKRLAPIINPNTHKVMLEGAVIGGFFAARKRDNALVGTQGGMQFATTERYPQGVSIGWEVPLSIGSNRLLVSARFTGSASEFSNKTNDHGEQEDTSQSTKGAVVSGRVHGGSGSEGYYIFTIK